MEVELQQLAGQQGIVRRYDYDDRTVVAADLGPAAEPTVEVVDGTAIVVVGDRQADLDLPAGQVAAFNHNGIVTIEVNK